MRVVIPVLGLQFGGERIIVEIANGLSARGHEVILLLPYGTPIAWSVKAALSWVPALTSGVFPPCDIILPNFYPTVLPAFQSGKGRCVRLSLGYEPLWIDRPEAAASYQLGMPVICISHWQRNYIIQSTHYPVYVIHPGADPAAFHPVPKPADGLQRVLYLMRSKEYFFKGCQEFAAAHAMLAPHFPQLRVVIIPAGGRGDLYYPHPCIWQGAPDDMEMGRLYAQADVFVYPSRFESLGLPPLEAMACGTAVVLTDCGGVREYARHLENCLLVEVGNPQALASSIGALLSDQPARNRLAAEGVRTAAEWTWQRTYQEVENILGEVLRS